MWKYSIYLIIIATYMASLLDSKKINYIELKPKRDQYNVSFYFSLAGPMKWMDAMKFCKGRGLALAYFADWKRHEAVNDYRYATGLTDQKYWLAATVEDDCKWEWHTFEGRIPLEWATALNGNPKSCGSCLYLNAVERNDYGLIDKKDPGKWETDKCDSHKLPLCMSMTAD